MRTIQIWIIVLGCVIRAQAQQNLIIYTDTIAAGSSSFILSSNQLGPATGSNKWITNNSYNGAPVYGNTPGQDSVLSGTINGAPNSYYLHIHDEAALVSDNVDNANWNPTVASNQFAVINNSFCTLGLQDVAFTFFWVGEGNTDAYGEVYYRKNGGQWQKTGQAKYNNQSVWKYEAIMDTGFNNAELLQFGFRWVNSTGGTANVSFGVDDIVIAGTYSQDSTPISISQLIPSSICKGGFITIGYTLSNSLCDGFYQIEMSDSAGSFTNTYNGGVFSIFAGDTAGFIGFQVPGEVSGSCFKIRINRISPAPVATGQASSCFSILNCPNSITTVLAPVMNDADTACILSAIDVRFVSTGVFGPGSPFNNYIAELSDANGSFNSPVVLGVLTSNQDFPSLPGTISGTIPAMVPAGCGYYIRVRSTRPDITGNAIGPFCLTRCDILTNSQQDMQFCIPQLNTANGLCNPLNVQINHWNNIASYSNCNRWKVELRSMANFALVDTGNLGIFTGSISDVFNLCVPAVRELLPVGPGAYYMRIVSTCSNQPWNQTGTVIRVTIGAPDTTAPVITFDDSIVCNTALAKAYVSPFNSQASNYEWISNLLNDGNPFIWQFNPLLVDLSAGQPPPGTYIFYVREKNFGCYGPYSRAALLYVNDKPELNITGPDVVCPGTTAVYSTGYYPFTYYDWTTASTATILNEGNNESGFVFSTPGSYTIQNYAVSECGNDLDTINVTVVQTLTVADKSYSLCKDSAVAITVNAQQAVPNVLPGSGFSGTESIRGGMFNINARNDIVIDSFAVKFNTSQLQQQTIIYGKPGSYRMFEYSPQSWVNLGSYYNFQLSPQGTYTVLPVAINQPIAAGDTFAFYLSMLSTVGMGCYHPFTAPGSVYNSDDNLYVQHGNTTNSAFSGVTTARLLDIVVYYSVKNKLSYEWNTGDTTAAILVAPAQSSTYTVDVTDDVGCSASATVQVTVIDCTTSVTDNQQVEQVVVVPNPTGGHLFLKGLTGPFTLTITDATGRQVLAYNDGNTMPDISALPAGIYLLRVSADNRIFSTRIVLQK